MAIGRVSVEVTPDARGFIAKLRGEILPGADKLGVDMGQKIGDAAGRTARRRINEFLKDIKAKVNVNVDTGKAQAQLAALRKETDATSKSADRAGAHYGILMKALLLIGPALIPLGAAATAGFGAMIEGAGVALLAVKGIQREMKDGTLLGRAYSGVLKVLKSDYLSLSSAAAHGTFQGISDSIQNIQGRMPELTKMVKLFSSYLGTAASNVVDGILNGFVVMQPVVQAVLSGFVNLTARFDAWTKGGGLEKFADAVMKELPMISSSLGDIFSAIGRLIVAGNGVGLVYLQAFSAIARAINDIPTKELAILITLIIGIKIAFMTWEAISGVVTTVSKNVKKLGVEMAVLQGVEKEAAVANATFGASLLALSGPLILIAGLAIAAHEALHWESSHSGDPGLLGKITTALQGGIVGRGKGKQSEQDKIIKTLTSTYNQLTAAQLLAAAGQQKVTDAMVVGAGAADDLTQRLNTLNDEFLNAASADTTFWQSLNTTTKTLKSNKDAILGHSDAALADRAALESLTNAAQQESIAKAKSTKNEYYGIISLKASKLAIEAKLRSQGLLTKAVLNYINSIFKIPKGWQTVPVFKNEAANKRLADYLKSIKFIPSHKTTTFDANTGTAVTKVGNLLTLYNALTNKTITVTVFGSADTGLKGPGHAKGGWITGAGTSTSDSVLTPTSVGEFVVPATAAAANAPYLEAITAQARGFSMAAGTSHSGPAAVPPITINQVDNPVATAYAIQRRWAFAGKP